MVEPVEHFARQDAVDLGDDGAGGFERLGRLDGNASHVAFQRLSGAGIEHQAEAQLARRLVDCLPVKAAVGRQARAVAAVRLRQHAHHQRRIIDGAGHRAGDAADIGRIEWNAPKTRLKRDQAAP